MASNINDRLKNDPVFLPGERFAGALGLARRAGRIIPGMSPASDAVRSERKPALVLIDDAASPTTQSKIRGLCFANGVPYLVLRDPDIGHAVGISSAIMVAAVTDEGFACRIRKQCSESPDDPRTGHPASQ